MNVNTDFKAYITLAVLVLGLTFTILALSTDHWYDIKIGSQQIIGQDLQTGMYRNKQFNVQTIYNVDTYLQKVKT